MAHHVASWVTVLATGDSFLVALAKSLLQEADIPYVSKGEILQDFIGFGRVGLGFNQITGPVELMVPKELAEEALLIFTDLEEYPSLKHA